MKPPSYLALLSCAALLSSCSSSSRPPAADDWTTIYKGKGQVGVTVRNESDAALFMKLQRPDSVVAAQTELPAHGSDTVSLPWGTFSNKIKLIHSPSTGGNVKLAMKPGECYRAPSVTVSPGDAHLSLTLKISNTTNLTPITEEEFNR